MYMVFLSAASSAMNNCSQLIGQFVCQRCPIHFLLLHGLANKVVTNDFDVFIYFTTEILTLYFIISLTVNDIAWEIDIAYKMVV